MNILVTNDDGVMAPGLLALAQELRAFSQVTVLAPDRNWSASGHSKSIDNPLRVEEVQLADKTYALTSNGAPSDCVALGLLGLLSYQVDVVVVGINPSMNVGADVTYSGTVAAAMEAVIWGVPGIAISMGLAPGELKQIDYRPAARVSRVIVEKVVRNGLPQGVLLNVNVPNAPDGAIRGLRLTRQGTRKYQDTVERRVDPRGRPYFWVIGKPPTNVVEEDTDIGALVAGYASITPLQLGMTAFHALAELSSWEL